MCGVCVCVSSCSAEKNCIYINWNSSFICSSPCSAEWYIADARIQIYESKLSIITGHRKPYHPQQQQQQQLRSSLYRRIFFNYSFYVLLCKIGSYCASCTHCWNVQLNTNLLFCTWQFVKLSPHRAKVILKKQRTASNTGRR